MPDLEALLQLAVETATEAAALLVAEQPRAARRIDTKTSATDPVTEVDRRCEALIVDRLLSARPDDGVVGEEGASRSGRSGVQWVIDPIDATVNFLYGLPGFAVSIAAEIDDTPAVGVVVDPSHGDTFAASAGGGATRNGATIAASAETRLDHALVATGFSYRPERRERQARLLVDVLPRVRDIRRMGSAAVDLCSVACGRVDAFYEELLNPWDFAAGALIAAEAGAVVTDGEGGPPSALLCLAAPPALHAELEALLRAHAPA